MTYEELRDYALQCSLEHHLCNVEELVSQGWQGGEILTMVEQNSPMVTVWEPYEYYEPSSLAEAIEDMRGVKVHEFMEVLTRVNGTEWATNYKEGLKS
jgi:hypothetical protein